MKANIAGSLGTSTFCQVPTGWKHHTLLLPPPSAAFTTSSYLAACKYRWTVTIICRELQGWLFKIGDANVQLLQFDSDEWRGEEGLHGWVPPLGSSVWSELHPCASGSGGCWAGAGTITEQKCLCSMGQGQLPVG